MRAQRRPTESDKVKLSCFSAEGPFDHGAGLLAALGNVGIIARQLPLHGLDPAVEVAHRLRDEMERIRPTLPKDIDTQLVWDGTMLGSAEVYARNNQASIITPPPSALIASILASKAGSLIPSRRSGAGPVPAVCAMAVICNRTHKRTIEKRTRLRTARRCNRGRQRMSDRNGSNEIGTMSPQHELGAKTD